MGRPKSQDVRYSIDVQPLSGLVIARRGETVLASSRNARVMYETHHDPMIYFPLQDVAAKLSEQTQHRTFCPFKGTASYRNLILPDQTIENAVWSYDDAFPEADAISGYVSFMPDAVSDVDPGPNALSREQDEYISGPLAAWLMKDAATLSSPEAFTEGLVQRFLDNGVSLSRLSVMIWSLHPMIAGKNYIWEKEIGRVVTRATSYDIYDHPSFKNSPLRRVSEGSGGFRQRLDIQTTDANPAIIGDMHYRGETDYVAMPLTFSDGQINVLTFTCDQPDGFTTADLGALFECSAVISRYYEVFRQRDTAQSLLETYVGKRSGARVLGGKIRRGQGDEIDAAIMFCDLRNSTQLVEELGQDDYLAMLNEFFDISSTIVHDNEGEVLKFIGDAVLAVFPASSDYSAACTQVLTSSREIVARLGARAEQCDGPEFSCAIGISYGTVTYGNVGSRERLDFTVVGQAANVAARLCDYAKSVGQDIVASQEVVCSDEAKVDLGPVELRNVSDKTHVFGVSMPPAPAT